MANIGGGGGGGGEGVGTHPRGDIIGYLPLYTSLLYVPTVQACSLVYAV